jgi:S-adenosylmethionine:tRNA ribosyltransferase-isomerase
MRTSDFDYDLPQQLIAQEPVEPRDSARLLVHRVRDDVTTHGHVSDLPHLLEAGDLLVMNDTRVLPARLFGRRATGGAVEFLFVRPRGDGAWWAMARPAARLRPGEIIELEDKQHVALAVERCGAEDEENADLWAIQLSHRERGPVPAEEVMATLGHMPLPPYIRRDAASDPNPDRERYQTVYAARPGAVAAPTAGLHITEGLLERVAARGVETAFVTLHVGPGTFRPVTEEDLGKHVMHSESFELTEKTAEAVARCRERGGRVVAVGTTTVRVLESCSRGNGVRPTTGETNIFLRPGRELQVVDALLTNFHLPRSTLLMLVSAFVGRERTLRLYAEAMERSYRFYSYGDAMFLV